MPGRKIRDADDARSCLHEVAQSGVDRVTWARDNGIDARSLNAWRINLRQRERADDPQPLRLVELVPTSPPKPTRPGVRICRGSWAIEVDSDFDSAVLIQVLDAVAQC